MQQSIKTIKYQYQDPDTPGSLLRSARESQGITVDKVAAKLNLLKSVVQNLEQDCYDRMRGDTFVRGYMRNYARLLGISSEEVVLSYETLKRARGPRYTAAELTQARSNATPGIIGSLAIMLGLGALPDDGKRGIGVESPYVGASSEQVESGPAQD